MRASLVIASGVWLAVTVIFAGSAQRPPAGAETPQATLERYCLTCHNQNLKERSVVPIAFDKLNLSNIPADSEVWEKVVRKVRAGLMPLGERGPGSDKFVPQRTDINITPVCDMVRPEREGADGGKPFCYPMS